MRLERLMPAAVAAVGLFMLSGLASADDHEFKQMRIVVGSSAGGGFDAFGRMVGRNMGQYLPGKPNFVVSNLPGAGSRKAIQSLKANPNDGTYMVLFNPGQILGAILEPEKVKINFNKDVSFVGSATADARVCYAWGTKGIKTLDDLLKQEQFTTGHTSNTSSTYIDAAILKNVFGAKIKQIVGYPGSSEQRLAVERGELDGDCGSYDSVPDNWIRDNKIDVFIRISKVKVPELKDVPSVLDYADADQKRVVNLLTAHNEMFRPFIVRKDVPADRLAALRKAFSEMVKGEPFLADAKRSKRAVLDPLDGAELDRMVAELYETPANLVAKAAEAVK